MAVTHEQNQKRIRVQARDRVTAEGILEQVLRMLERKYGKPIAEAYTHQPVVGIGRSTAAGRVPTWSWQWNDSRAFFVHLDSVPDDHVVLLSDIIAIAEAAT